MPLASNIDRERFLKALMRSAPDYQIELDRNTQERLTTYFSLVTRWNDRLHLTAPCTPEEFATRHVLESLTLLAYLPPNSRVADIGSGGGLPLIPCLIARPDLRGDLIEASAKKAVFLREALRETHTSSQATVLNDRFENLPALTIDFVTSRALERFQEILPELIEWAPRDCKFLLFGGENLAQLLSKLGLNYDQQLLPRSKGRFLFVISG